MQDCICKKVTKLYLFFFFLLLLTQSYFSSSSLWHFWLSFLAQPFLSVGIPFLFPFQFFSSSHFHHLYGCVGVYVSVPWFRMTCILMNMGKNLYKHLSDFFFFNSLFWAAGLLSVDRSSFFLFLLFFDLVSVPMLSVGIDSAFFFLGFWGIYANSQKQMNVSLPGTYAWINEGWKELFT